jgi:hypothetical protein
MDKVNMIIYYIMYIVHETDIPQLKSILKDGYIKSYNILKNQNQNKNTKIKGQGEGIYIKNDFVYFICTENLFDKNLFGHVRLFFNSSLIKNKTFYVSTMHSPDPDYLIESVITKPDGTIYKEYKRKYEKNYRLYNNVLKKLYQNSMSKLKNGSAFSAFQQIALKNKINLNELVGIYFNSDIESNQKLIKYIKKYYSKIIINCNGNII